MGSEISLSRVSVTYTRGTEKLSIFEHLDLNIAAGEFVSVMGPSGSGKSTLLNLIGGLMKPTSGHVVVDGTDLVRLSGRQLTRWRASGVGFISQFYNLMPVLNAAENVELPLMLRALSKARRRDQVDNALRLVGLQDRARHRPAELSGGQQQRVAIARALASDPELILADEPTGDLDRESATQIMRLLATLNEEMRKTIVLVTHDPNAARFAKRGVHLEKGSLLDRLEQAA